MAVNFRGLVLQIIWMLCNDATFLAQFSTQITPDMFGNVGEKLLVQWAIEHYNEYGAPITEKSLEYRLSHAEDDLESYGVEEEDIWLLFDNLDAVGKKDRDFVYKEAEKFRQHQALNVALKSAQNVLKEDGPQAAWEIIDKARGSVQKAEIHGSRLKGNLSETLMRIGERADEMDHISTGMRTLDKLMDGGVKPGELAVFIAPTGRGKTMWLCQCAASGMMHGNSDVVYYTLEVEHDEIFLRTLASLSKSPINELREYAQAGGDEMMSYRKDAERGVGPIARLEALYKRVKLVGGQDTDLYIRDIAIRGANLDTIFADLERLRAGGADPKLMIIDYADRLNAKQRHDRAHEDQEEIYKELALAAKEYNIAIWTASQAGRAGLKTAALTLDLIQGSFAKTFEATYVVAAGQSVNMAKERPDEYVFLMAKSRRSGSAGRKLWVKHDLSVSSFYGQLLDEHSGEVFDEDDDGEFTTGGHSYEPEPMTEEEQNEMWYGRPKGKTKKPRGDDDA